MLAFAFLKEYPEKVDHAELAEPGLATNIYLIAACWTLEPRRSES